MLPGSQSERRWSHEAIYSLRLIFRSEFCVVTNLRHTESGEQDYAMSVGRTLIFSAVI